MAFIITYSMLTGTWQREAATPEAAVVQYHELKSAGAGRIMIHDTSGRAYTLDELTGPLGPAAGSPADKSR